MDLSIIIVNHNTRELTQQTIDSVIKGTHTLDYEIVVVDNSNKKEEYYTPQEGQPVILLPMWKTRGLAMPATWAPNRPSGIFFYF